VPEVGVVTTKSISAAPREGYREPIYARFGVGSYINAVGLANPGAEAFLDEVRQVQVPSDKFLLVSIFGANVADFQAAAEILSPIADGFELNLSCPHASGYGIEIGQDVDLCGSIIRGVKKVSGVPIFAKLSTQIPSIGRTAAKLIGAGASGISVSNSVGPATVYVGDTPVLNHVIGGISGNALRPFALLAVKSVREAVGPDPVILGMGGIGTAEHVMQFRMAGADLFGIGSALTGRDSSSGAAFFSGLQAASSRQPRSLGGESADSSVPMTYERCLLSGRQFYSDDLFEIQLSCLPGRPNLGELAGRYYFLFIPGVGEKPFAVFSAESRRIVVRKVGYFTSRLAELPIGAEILVRGPYGRMVSPLSGVSHYILAGGGTGTASLLEIAHKLSANATLQFVLGSRSRHNVFGVDEFRSLGSVEIATDDGSLGHRGHAAEVLGRVLEQVGADRLQCSAVVSCGPAPMVEACISLARQFLPDERIVSAIEYQTSCGVGVCGKCASPSGHLTCIDGPFLSADAFRQKGSNGEPPQPHHSTSIMPRRMASDTA
jgi:dihydroorotate dehydrogenase (NAD+) catalytic subunit